MMVWSYRAGYRQTQRIRSSIPIPKIHTYSSNWSKPRFHFAFCFYVHLYDYHFEISGQALADSVRWSLCELTLRDRSKLVYMTWLWSFLTGIVLQRKYANRRANGWEAYSSSIVNANYSENIWEIHRMNWNKWITIRDGTYKHYLERIVKLFHCCPRKLVIEL